MSEREVSRLAQDLRSGNAQDAVNVIRQELQNHPQYALQELRQANAIAGPNARLHLGQKADGDMALVDNSGRAVAHLGHLQQQQYNNNWNTQGRYQDNNWNDQGRYQDNSWNNQGRYQDNSWNNQGRYQDNFYNQSQGQIGRLAQDLARGDARDAVRATQDILRNSNDPSRAINEANRLADQMACRMGYRSAMEHIANTRDGSGNLAVVDQYGRQLARIENCQPGYNNNGWNNNNNNYDRYSNYPNNGSYYQNGSSYYDGRPSYAPTQNNSRYGNGYYNGSYNNNHYDDCPPQQRYYGNNNNYNNYNRLNGGQAAAAIGIGIVGGLILSNIGRHNNNNNFHRGRW